MADLSGAVIVDARLEPEARCLACGNEIPAGDGLAARWQGQRRDPGRFQRAL